MIPTLETAGFFMAIAAALQFSSWAERWLRSNTWTVEDPALEINSIERRQVLQSERTASRAA